MSRLDLFLIWLFGVIVGLWGFSGIWTVTIWKFNPDLLDWHYYINLSLVAIIFGFAFVSVAQYSKLLIHNSRFNIGDTGYQEMVNLWSFLIWFYGFAVGFGTFSGITAQLFGIPQVWIFNTALPVWIYYLDLYLISVLTGFATLGMFQNSYRIHNIKVN